MEMEGAAVGSEKLKPSGPGLAAVNREKLGVVMLLMVLELVWSPVPPKVELDNEEVWGLFGSGLALKMGLKRASLAGLKLNSEEPNALLWVTF